MANPVQRQGLVPCRSDWLRGSRLLVWRAIMRSKSANYVSTKPHDELFWRWGKKVNIV